MPGWSTIQRMNARTDAHRLLPLTLLAIVLLVACSTQESPPPEVVDPAGFATYAHPSGTFRLSLPPDWVVSDTSDTYALNVGFSPPGSPEPLIGVTVIEAAVLGDPADLDALIERYQAAFLSLPEGAYQEASREPQPDGSMRLQYLVSIPGSATQHNDFVQVVGPYFVALRTTLPDDETQVQTLGRVVNTLEVNGEAGWSSVAGGENALGGAVGFTSLNHWLDSNGGFVLAGQVRNNSTEPLEFVRINAGLYDGENTLLIELDDFVSADRIPPGGLAPFSILFADGLPEGTVRYDLAASARYARDADSTFYGSENFTLTSQAEFDDNGVLVVSGQIRNEGPHTANLVKVIAAVFDVDGRIVGTDTTLADVQTLAPGETSGYAVRFFELGGLPETFLISAQGVLGE